MTLQVELRTRHRANGASGFQLEAGFEAGPGVTVIVGRSGAGKTTLLRSIAGLPDPDEGRVAVGGRVLFDSQRRVRVEPSRRRVAFVVQDLALFPHLSVEDNVGYGLRRLDRAERQRRMDEVVESFQIAHLRRRSPREISGGERQRVALARALVTEPSVLLLDEPLSSLDPTTKVRIIDDLQRWNETHHLPILYVTHDRGELVALGDRVIVLEHGRIVEEGAPTDATLAPARAAAAHQAGFENVFEATVIERRDHEGTMVCRVAGTEVVLVAPAAPVSEGSEVCLGVRAGDILLSTSPPTMLSACNILPGTVRQVRRNGAAAEVRVRGAAELRVRLAADSAVEEATEVWAVFASQACHLVRPVRLDALRRLFVFVCHANTVRSPMAQSICDAEIAGRFAVSPAALDGLGVKAMSAGLRARPGEAVHDEAVRALGQIGVPSVEHRSRNLTPRLAERAEAIFCMTEAQRRELVALFPAAGPKSHRVHPDIDIVDPHGQSAAGFVECARQLRDSIRLRLTALGVGVDDAPGP